MAKLSKANERRINNWQHNSLLGTVALLRTHLKRIANAKSASPNAKKQAQHIDNRLRELNKELRKHRVEPDGTLTEIGDKDVRLHPH